MTQSTTNVARMKSPSTGFSGSITRIDNAFNVRQSNITSGTQILNSKPLIVSVMRTSSRAVLVNHGNISLVVSTDEGGTRGRKTEF